MTKTTTPPAPLAGAGTINDMAGASRAVAAYRPVEIMLRDPVTGEPTRAVAVRQLKAAAVLDAMLQFGGLLRGAIEDGSDESLRTAPEFVRWLVRECTGMDSAQFGALDLDEAALLLSWCMDENFGRQELRGFFASFMRSAANVSSAFAGVTQQNNAPRTSS